MLKVPYYKQDTKYSCGAAALQMVFAFFGKHQSEEALTERLGTNKENGTEHSQIIKVITEEGLFAYANNDSSLEEIQEFLDLKTPVIVNFIEPGEDSGHYAVVVKIVEDDIILNDPWHGAEFRMKKEEFLNRWHSENGNHKRWLVAVSRENFNLGKQYLAK